MQGVLPGEGAAIVEQALELLMAAAYEEQQAARMEAEGIEGKEGQGEDTDVDGAPHGDASAEASVRALSQRVAYHETRGQRRADALVRMAEHVLAHAAQADSQGEDLADPGGARVELRLHVDVSALALHSAPGAEDGDRAQTPRAVCELEGPHNRRTPVPIETARRLSCDAARVTILEGPPPPGELRGEPLAVGRRTRTLPPAIQRALHARDGRCRFPSCTQVAYLHGHHIQHWAEGGETALDNLIQLCRFHHRLVHEEQFQVRPLPWGGFEFRRPDGEVLATQPLTRTAHWMDLINGNRRRGLSIDETTLVPRWYGDVMDHQTAVQALLRRDGLLHG